MKPLLVPDNRGKDFKVTPEIVKRIVDKAADLKKQEKRIRIKQFTANLRKNESIKLSTKTVREILIANDMIDARSRKKRPKFYQSLCQRIPNSLLSIDGSEFTVWLGDSAFKFNVELSVDVNTFAHTAYSIAESETAREIINVLEAHRKKWGVPIGILSDSGSANLSEDVRSYIKEHGMEPVPVGPGNPKGNGTDEGAFSQIKQAIGDIRLDMSSQETLARSILDALISLYIHMRNRLCLHNARCTPAEHMARPVTEKQRSLERQKLKAHNQCRAIDEDTQLKLDRLNWVIKHHEIVVTPEALKRAQHTIKVYNLKVIGQAEAAFVKSIERKSERKTLPYFFGILRNIQQEHDDEALKNYCRERYNHQIMQKLERQENSRPDTATVDDVLKMLIQAVRANGRIVKDLAVRKAREWTHDLMRAYNYIGSLKKKFSDALGNLTDLSMEQKQQSWELIEQFLD